MEENILQLKKEIDAIKESLLRYECRISMDMFICLLTSALVYKYFNRLYEVTLFAEHKAEEMRLKLNDFIDEKPYLKDHLNNKLELIYSISKQQIASERGRLAIDQIPLDCPFTVDQCLDRVP